MTRTSIRLSLLAAAACFALGTVHAQTTTPSQGASPSAPGTTARDTGTAPSGIAPGTQAREQDTSTRATSESSTKTTPTDDTTHSDAKAKKKNGTKKSNKSKTGELPADADTSGTATQPAK